METVAQIPIPEIKLVYTSKLKPSERPKITSSKDAYDLLLSIWDTGVIDLQEQFKVLLLNRANRVLGFFSVSTGAITHTVADPRLIMMAAINSGACSIMLAHNHPSGSLKPSRQDEELTNKIKQAASFLDIKVLDHIIVTTESFYSFAEEGLL